MGQGSNGCLSGMSEEQARQFVAEYLVDFDGKLVHAAHHIGYSRSHIYRLIRRHRLWPLVNQLRLSRIERERQDKKHGLQGKRVLSDADAEP